MTIDSWYIVFVIIQLIHSQEELHAGFYKKSPIFPMPKKRFIIFEILFSTLIVSFAIFKQLPLRDVWMPFFILLMFANGVEHFLWWLSEKRYVPGIVTAVITLLVFIIFYFYFIFRLG